MVDPIIYAYRKLPFLHLVSNVLLILSTPESMNILKLQHGGGDADGDVDGDVDVNWM